MFKALVFSSLVLNLGLFAGRLSGFVREAFIAATYGATAEADIVVLMLTVPDLLVNILMGGALGAVLIPEFSQNQGKARQLLYQSLLFFGVLFLFIAVVLYFQSDVLVSLLVPGFGENQAEKAAIALGWVIWLLPLTILAGVVTAYLHAQNCFAVAAFGTLIINCTIIAGLLLVYYGYGALYLVALFVLLGGMLRLASQLLWVRFMWAPFSSLFPFYLNRSLMVRYGQAMMSGSVLLLFPVVARAIASYQGEGSVSLFNYAARLVEFPLAIAVTFLAAVFFPRLSATFADDSVTHKVLIQYGVQITLALSLVASITLISLRESYVSIIYGYGGMQSSSLLLIISLTSIGLIALPMQGFSSFLTAIFNSRKNTRTPMLINSMGLLFFLFLNMVGIFGGDLKSLMWGMVVSYGLICLLQLLALKIEKFSWKLVFFDRSFLSGVLCGLVLLAIGNYWISLTLLPAWLALVMGCLLSLLSLGVMALFNKKLRLALKSKMSAE